MEGAKCRRFDFVKPHRPGRPATDDGAMRQLTMSSLWTAGTGGRNTDHQYLGQLSQAGEMGF